MTRTQLTIVLIAVLNVFAVPARAATLSLAPGTISVMPSGSFSIDLVIAGLGDLDAPSVGDFDIDVGFDPLALSLIGFDLGTELGDLTLGEAIDVSFGEIAAGLVNVAQVSFLSDAELNTTQPDTFVLATFEFTVSGLAGGESTVIDIASVWSLGDALGNPIPVTQVSSAVVTAIPVPAALWGFAAGIAWLAGMSNRRCAARR